MGTETTTPVGTQLRAHRLAAGLTQEMLAERAGISARSVQAIEHGTNKPLKDTMRRLAAALELGAEEQTRLMGAATPIPRRSSTSVVDARSSAQAVTSVAPSGEMGNPFFHRGPVRDAAYFCGRDRETRFAAELLRQGQSVAINGPRRLGKTSLLFHVADPAIAAAHGLDRQTTRWIYLDGGSLDGLNEDWLYGAIDRALGGAEDAVPYTRLVTRLHDTAARGLRVILAVDEFELVAANPFFGPAVFNRLRGLTARFSLQIVTASRDPLLDLTTSHPETLSSPFFNIFAPLHLALFSEDEAQDLLVTLSERGGRPFSPRTRAWLLDLVGPHPLFLQIAGYRAFAALDDAGAKGELRDTVRPEVRAAIAADLDQHLRYYWHALDAEAQYTLAALPLLDQEPRSAALEHLAAAGLLRSNTYLGHALEDFVRRQAVEGLLQAGPVLMDLRRRLTTVRGAPVHLTPTESAALRLFLERRSQVISPEEIEAALWPGEFVADPERARGVVKKLRGALGEAGDLIANRRGHGYVLMSE